jgi:crotonobetainyl-CoA:carnitine CoA-transferase CaiB-like acyl-CoA transferase
MTHEDELDACVPGRMADDRRAKEVMSLLGAAGVPICIMRADQGLLSNPQLAYRHRFRWTDHQVVGHHACHAPAHRMSATPALPTRAAPCLGRHNQHVYQDLLGFGENEMAELLADGVIMTENDALAAPGR